MPRHVAVILCEPYTSHNLRNVVRSIQSAHDLPDGLPERITDLAAVRGFRSAAQRDKSQSLDEGRQAKFYKADEARHTLGQAEV